MVDSEETLEAVKEFYHLEEMLSVEGSFELAVPTLQVFLGVSLAISTTSHQPLSAILVLTFTNMYSEHYFEPRHEKTCFLHISVQLFDRVLKQQLLSRVFCHWYKEQTCIVTGKIYQMNESVLYSYHN